MLNQNELNEMRAEIASIESEIRSLNDRKKEIEAAIMEDKIAKERARFPGINNGDKVLVTLKKWTGKPETATYYFNRVGMVKCSYYGIQWVFALPKKNGSRGLREEHFIPDAIVNIEKVVE